MGCIHKPTGKLGGTPWFCDDTPARRFAPQLKPFAPARDTAVWSVGAGASSVVTAAAWTTICGMLGRGVHEEATYCGWLRNPKLVDGLSVLTLLFTVFHSYQ